MPTRKARRKQRPPNFNGPILRRLDARAFVNFGPTQFDKLVRANKLPQPIKLTDTGKAVGWLKSELESWLAARVAKRDDGAAS
jgi:predicted DNA-binding transcriptional regulator AlpA